MSMYVETNQFSAEKGNGQLCINITTVDKVLIWYDDILQTHATVATFKLLDAGPSSAIWFSIFIVLITKLLYIEMQDGNY